MFPRKDMPRLERLWERQNRTTVLAISGGIVLVIAIIDWWTKPYVSLGFLYLFPIMLAAAFLPRWVVALLGLGCAASAEIFSSLAPSYIRLTFETLALAGCGLFVGELVRNRRFSLESQARLKALTGGQGAYTMELSHYDPVPGRKQQELVQAWRPRAEEE